MPSFSRTQEVTSTLEFIPITDLAWRAKARHALSSVTWALIKPNQ